MFCSVVPKTFKIIKKFITNNYKIKCVELKDLKIDKLIKIKVNKKQIGSDRLANAIGAMNNKDNFIILELVNIYEEFIKKVSKLSLTTIKNL